MTTDPMRITETGRAPRAEEPVHLQRAIWHHLHKHARDTQRTREAAARGQAAERERLYALVADLARAHHQLTVFLAQNAAAFQQVDLTQQAELLTTIRDRYGQVLTRAGAELLYLDEGQPLGPDFQDTVQIIVSVPCEGIGQPSVLETVSPGVYLDSELVSRAEVRVAVPVRAATTGDESGPATGDVR